MKLKIVIDEAKLAEKLKEPRDKRGFIAKEWQRYYFQEPTYSVKYSSILKK